VKQAFINGIMGDSYDLDITSECPKTMTIEYEGSYYVERKHVDVTQKRLEWYEAGSEDDRVRNTTDNIHLARCYKHGKEGSLEYQNCRNSQECVPAYIDRMRSKDAGGPRFLNELGSMANRDRYLWMTENMTANEEEKMLDSWCTQALASNPSNGFNLKLSTILYMRKYREKLTKDMDKIREREMKKFVEDVYMKECLPDGGSTYTFEYSKCRAVQACSEKYAEKFQMRSDEEQLVKSWCDQAIDTTQSAFINGDKHMFNSGMRLNRWNRWLNIHITKIYDEDKAEQEKLEEQAPPEDRRFVKDTEKLSSDIKTKFTCPTFPGPQDFNPFKMTYYPMQVKADLWVTAKCIKFTWDTKRFGKFLLEFGWAKIEGKYAMYIKLQICAPLQQMFGIPPPISVEVCIGGGIEFRLWSECPQVKGTQMTGFAFMSFSTALDFEAFSIVFFSVELGVKVGMDWYKAKTKNCWKAKEEGAWRRRRNRRRTKRKCHYAEACDNYVKGYLNLETFYYTWIKIQLEYRYWVKKKVSEIFINLFAHTILFGWAEAYSKCVYRRKVE